MIWRLLGYGTMGALTLAGGAVAMPASITPPGLEKELNALGFVRFGRAALHVFIAK